MRRRSESNKGERERVRQGCVPTRAFRGEINRARGHDDDGLGLRAVIIELAKSHARAC